MLFIYCWILSSWCSSHRYRFHTKSLTIAYIIRPIVYYNLNHLNVCEFACCLFDCFLFLVCTLLPKCIWILPNIVDHSGFWFIVNSDWTKFYFKWVHLFISIVWFWFHFVQKSIDFNCIDHSTQCGNKRTLYEILWHIFDLSCVLMEWEHLYMSHVVVGVFAVPVIVFMSLLYAHVTEWNKKIHMNFFCVSKSYSLGNKNVYYILFWFLWYIYIYILFSSVEFLFDKVLKGS